MAIYIIVAVLAFIVSIVWTNIDIIVEINELKGYNRYDGGLSLYIPVRGVMDAMKKETKSHIFDDSFHALVGIRMVISIFIKHFLTLLLVVLAAIPIIYFSGVSSEFRLIFTIFAVIVLWLTHIGIAGEVYYKKGYSKLAGNFIGVIPVYGLIQAFKLKARKQVFKGSFRSIIGVKEIFMKLLTFGFLTLAAFIVAFPVVYLIGSSFTNTTTLPTLLWPTSDLFTLQNYSDLFKDTQFLVWYKNTFIIALLSMLLGIIFVTGAGYVFARFRFKGKKAGLMTILVLQMFPSFMGLIAMFTLFQVFGLLGKPTWLVILYVGGSIPGNMWLIKGYLSQIPKDLDESAMLDGASKFQIFFKIILPLSVPILSFVSVGLFMAPWMDYMLPKYLLDVQLAGTTDPDAVQKQWTIAVGLFSMIQNPQTSSYTMFASGALIVAVPITILYMIFQRYLIEGIAAGATKG
ncbi:MAG: sugar ABC transporter permease [Bacilli bacterium]|nr:sugar ABC transporter permease [Bacilli bacterium]